MELLDDRAYAYYRAVARSVGVPELWVEDAAQEMALRAWQRGDRGALAIRRDAIDFVRGIRGRAGRPQTLGLASSGAVAAPAPEEAVVARLDIERFLRRLRISERALLRRVTLGEAISGSEEQLLVRLRRSWREGGRIQRFRRRCRGCAGAFWAESPRAHACSPRCGMRVWKGQRPEAFWKRCAACGAGFAPKRLRARYCSWRCYDRIRARARRARRLRHEGAGANVAALPHTSAIHSGSPTARAG